MTTVAEVPLDEIPVAAPAPLEMQLTLLPDPPAPVPVRPRILRPRVPYVRRAELLAEVDQIALPIDTDPAVADLPKIIDLFAGVGGLSLGAARAGFHVALAVELDEHAYAAHARNFPATRHRRWNLSDVAGDDLLRESGLGVGELDGLIGGPPCQGFSAMGRRQTDDARNNLFVKFYEFVSQCLPAFFIAENVPNILSEQYADILAEANALLENQYVLLDPMPIKASDYGSPTTRERVFFIGYRADAVDPLTHADFEAVKDPNQVRVAEALRGLPRKIRQSWLTEEQSWRNVRIPEPTEITAPNFWRRVSGHIPPGVGDPEAIRRYRNGFQVSGSFGTRHSPEVAARYRRLEPGQRDATSKSSRLKQDGFCPTLRAGTGSDHGSYQAVRPIHPTSPRVITPREAARLQGFPDWFRFAPSKWHSFRQIGNSVSPIVGEAVLSVILQKLI